MDHRHIFFFNPLQIQGEQISSKTVRHAIFEPRRRVALIWAQNPTAALFTHIPFGIRIAQNRMFAIFFAPFNKRRVRLGDDKLMFNGYRCVFDTQQLRRALGMVAGCGHDMLGIDNNLLVGRQ